SYAEDDEANKQPTAKAGLPLCHDRSPPTAMDRGCLKSPLNSSDPRGAASPNLAAFVHESVSSLMRRTSYAWGGTGLSLSPKSRQARSLCLGHHNGAFCDHVWGHRMHSRGNRLTIFVALMFYLGTFCT